ncbi:ABC transporter permease [Pseudomonas aeruginosa]
MPLTRGINAALDLFGAQPISLMFTPFAVILCMVYVHPPFMILPLYANLEKHDPALLDAAQDLGAGRWQRFWRVTFLPRCRRSRRRGTGIHPGAGNVRHPRPGRRYRRHHDRQP